MEATATKWEFLQPWVDALRSRVTLYGTTSPPRLCIGRFGLLVISARRIPGRPRHFLPLPELPRRRSESQTRSRIAAKSPRSSEAFYYSGKERILLKGGKIRRELGFVRPSVQWQIIHEVLGMVGDQKKTSKSSTETTEAYVPDLGELFDVEVPAVVLMNAFSSKSLPINMWTSPLLQDTMSSNFEARGTIHKVRVVGTSTGRITDSIARTAMARLELILDDHRIDQSTLGRAIENKGFLYSSLLCGVPICRLHGANLNYHALKHQCRIKRLDLSGYEWAYDTGIGAIYSAIAEAQTIEKLNVDPECDLPAENDREMFEGPMSQAHWCWLAYALWSKASKLSIRKLDLEAITLADEDVSVIEAVLQSSYPDPVSQRSGSESQLPHYGYVTVPAGTEVVLVDSESTVLVMTSGYRCRALFDPSTMDNHLNAVIPGYGICKVKLKDGQSLFMVEPPLPPGVLRTATATFRDLIFDCIDLESGEVMTRLLSLIGGNLRSLRVRNSEQNENMVELNVLAVACPMLEELYTFMSLT